MSISSTLGAVVAQAAPAAGGESALMGMLPIALMFVVLYFLMIRPQMKRQKEQKALIAALAKGEEVIAAGGLAGRITKVSDAFITLDIGRDENKPVEIVVQKAAVATVLPKGTLKTL
ncbi:preprotein translocase subunit YajC [Pigmentiphaga aceris]|uniref:Sec translocon accessory complex subunit YajC n=1 Tax=Pigmentiphaga aceris TaxID=1940612 RepID=A0A5C0B5S0_9BURK|nr:preprotein translocase subunit YajC [Pigmentiphaga aceris]QEI07887.1 preprotein translocase subunit YajC [Pigmentiphaga aceris]